MRQLSNTNGGTGLSVFTPVDQAPALFTTSRKTETHFWEFFITQLRNNHTRKAYFRAINDFVIWLEPTGVQLVDIEPNAIGIYIEHLGERLSRPSVKLYLTAIRQLFDYLVVKQVLTMNPAKSVKAPTHSVKIGKTPTLSAEEMRQLFDSIEPKGVCALRDRAIIATMAYSFARVSAVCGLSVADYYCQGTKSYYRLHEKNGVYNVVPTHHAAQEHMQLYLTAARIWDQPKTPLFRTMKPNRVDPADYGMSIHNVLAMVKRRCRQGGLPPEICNHSFRGTGITNYMLNGGTLEAAAHIAGHASTTTTQLYDRRSTENTLDEIERIRY